MEDSTERQVLDYFASVMSLPQGSSRTDVEASFANLPETGFGSREDMQLSFSDFMAGKLRLPEKRAFA